MAAQQGRRYHLSISLDALEADADLAGIVQAAGVTDLWLAAFFYGHWYCPLDKIQAWRQRLEKMGFATHIINVPLGHPGDSLGAKSGNFPLTPPQHWNVGTRPDGTTYAGTSLHPPATDENAAALKQIEAAGAHDVFLDDDFRLAQGPGVIGGCFCEKHRKAFCDAHGYGDKEWNELIEAVKTRALTPMTRAWVEFTCDQLTDCFRQQQAAAPQIQLGIMVMYLGAEKAGIRLKDYVDTPFRVGELMFDDHSFGTIKGKTNELFSALFHRRYAKPDLAYSETTAFPSDKLSAKNMAAKLAVSTISDVRNTMFMSGVTAFPKTHWQTLGPAMKRQAEIHPRLAGHALRGPFKHFWGEASRYVGDDNPYSLFLAAGVPFEVTDTPGKDGWTFLSDADAATLSNSLGTTFVARAAKANVRGIDENLKDLYALKHEIVPQLKNVPYVEDDKPVVCAWYPTAHAILLWNLGEDHELFTIQWDDKTKSIEVDGLGTALVESIL